MRGHQLNMDTAVHSSSHDDEDLYTRPMPSYEDVRVIGEILRDTRNLTAEQVGQVLSYQRKHGVRFGEAAIALGFATADDVLRALANQFHYAYAGQEGEQSNPELVVLNQPFCQQAEAFRAMRAQILLRTQPNIGVALDGPKVKRALAIISPDSGDGKTYFCANLAVALAQLGGRTLVVDADFRNPRLHEVFGVESGAGIAGLLSGRPGDKVIKPVAAVSNLFVLPVGIRPPNPLELLEGPTFGMLMHEVVGKFDHVVVDTAAAQHGADAIVVAARCGAALIVARRHQAKVDALQILVQSVSSTRAQLAGVIMNDY
jgi:protein-tyrosine kinase